MVTTKYINEQMQDALEEAEGSVNELAAVAFKMGAYDLFNDLLERAEEDGHREIETWLYFMREEYYDMFGTGARDHEVDFEDGDLGYYGE
jgi:hypothetical protein